MNDVITSPAASGGIAIDAGSPAFGGAHCPRLATFPVGGQA